MAGRISPLRLKEMICLAEFEEGRGKEDLRICQYGRSGYISLQMIKSFFCVTAASALLIAIGICGDPEKYLFALQDDFTRIFPAALVFYLLLTAAYLTVTYMKADLRYREAESNVRVYEERIRMLLRFPGFTDE